MTISDRLSIYTLSRCPECGDQKETIFAGPGLVCRKHPDHPLWEGRPVSGDTDSRTRRPVGHRK